MTKYRTGRTDEHGVFHPKTLGHIYFRLEPEGIEHGPHPNVVPFSGHSSILNLTGDEWNSLGRPTWLLVYVNADVD